MANAPVPGWRIQQPAKTDTDIFGDEDQAPESPAAARAARLLVSRQRSEVPMITKSIPPIPSCIATMPAVDTPLLRGCNAQQNVDETPLHLHEESMNSALAQMHLRILQNHYTFPSQAPPITRNIPPNPGCAAAMPAPDTPLLRTLYGCNAQQDIDKTPLHPHEHSMNSALAKMQLRIRQNHYTSPGGGQNWEGDVAHFKGLAASAYGKRALGWCEIAQHTIEEERASQAQNIWQKDAVIGELRREYDVLRRWADGEIGKLKREVAELKGLVPRR